MKRAFTIAEVFFTLVLLGAVFALAIVNYERIEASLNRRPLDELLRQTIRGAHLTARKEKVSVYLSYNKEAHALYLQHENGELLQAVPLTKRDQGSDEFSFSFYRILPGLAQTKQRTAEEAANEESETEDFPIEAVQFHPSGPSPPVQILLRTAESERVFVMDPFSSQLIEQSPQFL